MSQATIEAALRILLMEEGRACLPGIGTLVVEAQPALISLMEGKASPPSKYVSFNANLTLDDGRLRQEVGDSASVERYLATIRQTLSDDEAFSLPGVGKLYRQGTEEVRFAPGAINLSKASFGLPDVAIRPIVRKEGNAAAPANRPATGKVRKRRAVTPVGPPAAVTRWAWYLAAGVGILFALFLVFRLAGTIGVLLERDGESTSVDAVRVRPEPPPRLADSRPQTSVVEPAPPPPVALAPENVAVIAIGLFGRERNVRKQTRRLTEAGYTPYTDQEGRNTRVGLTVRYRDESELRRVLADVRQRYTQDAFVMRINGREQRPQ